jgi:hypothetical protein
MARSFESYHMDQVLFLHDHPFTPLELGELTWTLSHQNILSFLEGVPASRQLRMRYEDMVRQPEAAMRAMCDQIGIPYHPNLIHPYKDIDRKMTDRLYADSTPMGDTRLLERTSIDPRAADKWKGVLEDDFLGEVTWDVAGRFDYERPGTGAAAESESRISSRREGRDRLKERRTRRRS